MEILNSIFSWIIQKRIHQIELFVKYPQDVQAEVFSKLIASAKDTEWGKKYKYAEITNYEQFKERVPIQEYDDIKPYVERLQKGEENLLWPGKTKWFAKSSGTTSDKSKFIPVTTESLEECHYKGGKDMLALYYHNKPETKLFSGKSLAVGGSTQINQFSSDSYYGDLSAIIINNLPFWVEYRRTPDKSIALMGEWEEKIVKMAESTSMEDVTNIAGVPSWTLVLMNKILEIQNKKHIHEVWPHLELYIHGGVSFTPYTEQFKKIIPNGLDYLETYNASEGFFGIQDTLNNKEMLLMLDYGIFFEFMPNDQIGKENPKTLQLGDIELDKNYAILISTNGGLWRYMLGDTVMFTSKYPFRIKVTGRTKHFINAFGEELMVNNADEALNATCKETGAILNEYTAAPLFTGEGKGRHEWYIEFVKEPKDMEAFITLFDTHLKSLNSDYEAKRYKNMILASPLVKVLPPQTFYQWLSQKGKLGGQNKIPRLSNDRKYMDEISLFLK